MTPLILCLSKKIQPSVSNRPRKQARLYNLFSFIHSGTGTLFLILLPDLKQCCSKKRHRSNELSTISTAFEVFFNQPPQGKPMGYGRVYELK